VPPRGSRVTQHLGLHSFELEALPLLAQFVAFSVAVSLCRFATFRGRPSPIRHSRRRRRRQRRAAQGATGDESFREEVAAGDIIVISTGPNDGGVIFDAIQGGTCGTANDTSCVTKLARRWHRDFDAILAEIEELRAGKPTAIRLVNAANAFNDPSASPAALRGFEAYFEALTAAMCDNADKHDVTCFDVRPVLNGPDFEQPVNDSSRESMDAVAEL
jgi:hypothetical protein